MSQETNVRTYPIQRWDVVMFDNSVTKVPVIYIKPDDLFLAFAHKNHYAVMANISGTGLVYDGKIITGVVDKSSRVPNCKPRFFEKYGWYVVSLWSDWYGYPHPTKLGEVSFSGLYGVTEEEIEAVHDVLPDIPRAPQPLKYEVAKKERMNPMHIALIGGAIFILLILLVLLAMRKLYYVK